MAMSKLSSNIGKTYVWGSALISSALVLLIITVLIANSSTAISEIGLDLFSLQWNASKGEFGILSMLYGTLTVTCIALTIATPIGLLTAIYTSEYLPRKRRLIVKSLFEILAGIPSIIYGLIGVAFFSLWVEDIFNLLTGRTILTAGFLVALMIIPSIITLVDDALQQVPSALRDTATGLGLYKHEVLCTVTLPTALPQITNAILLALGRALGETMAVMLVIGSIDKIPSPFYNVFSPGQTITSKIGRELGESSFGSLHFQALTFSGLILLVIVMSITFLVQMNQNKSKE